ncbi:succinate dehydrogenase assembly factor 3, mitochondrial-like [Babylonia areolata]|uniref:succinate dehydrogenase assembly factor 3, mitochondrial-like n=1 Tax=Babylonia areolata TaxID=304850 RepID=UPI003FD3FD81
MAAASQHVSHVRALYKAILKLHRGLPLQMQALGDQYVKEEFRHHKEAGKQEVDIFMHEWTKYYVTLAKQLGPKHKFKTVGQNLSSELLNNFSDEQIGQLKELLDATTVPASPASDADEKR